MKLGKRLLLLIGVIIFSLLTAHPRFFFFLLCRQSSFLVGCSSVLLLGMLYSSNSMTLCKSGSPGCPSTLPLITELHLPAFRWLLCFQDPITPTAVSKPGLQWYLLLPAPASREEPSLNFQVMLGLLTSALLTTLQMVCPLGLCATRASVGSSGLT